MTRTVFFDGTFFQLYYRHCSNCRDAVSAAFAFNGRRSSPHLSALHSLLLHALPLRALRQRRQPLPRGILVEFVAYISFCSQFVAPVTLLLRPCSRACHRLTPTASMLQSAK